MSDCLVGHKLINNNVKVIPLLNVMLVSVFAQFSINVLFCIFIYKFLLLNSFFKKMTPTNTLQPRLRSLPCCRERFVLRCPATHSHFNWSRHKRLVAEAHGRWIHRPTAYGLIQWPNIRNADKANHCATFDFVDEVYTSVNISYGKYNLFIIRFTWKYTSMLLVNSLA